MPPAITHPADRLLAAIEAKRSPVCVGIDPVVERLPKHVHHPENHLGSPTPMAVYVEHLLSAVAPYVSCVKFQSACYEQFGFFGVKTMAQHIAKAVDHDLQVIVDAKRGDIGVSAEHYATAAFVSPFEHPALPLNESRQVPQELKSTADWLTINSYLGEDGITPFLKHEGHGAFALVRTSNPGGDAIQNLQLKDGGTVAEAVGGLIAQIGSNYIGTRGYSSLGAVVGATKREDAKRLREIMPQQLFLVPGYGAQGGGVDDVLPCFKGDGTGAIVTASRSVIYAFKQDDPKWMESVADAAAKFADEIGRAVGMR